MKANILLALSMAVLSFLYMGSVAEAEILSHSLNRTCDTTGCTISIQSSPTFFFEDGQWIEKDVTTAKSLKGVWNVEYLEQDGQHFIEVVDFNYTDIILNVNFTGNATEWEYEVDEGKIKAKFKEIDEFGIENEIEIEIENGQELGQTFSYPQGLAGRKWKFGPNSTTIQITDATTGNLADFRIEDTSPNTDSVIFKFNLTDYLNVTDKTFINSSFTVTGNSSTAFQKRIFYAGIDSQSIDENSAVGDIEQLPIFNRSFVDQTEGTISNLNVTNITSWFLDLGYDNLTVILDPNTTTGNHNTNETHIANIDSVSQQFTDGLTFLGTVVHKSRESASNLPVFSITYDFIFPFFQTGNETRVSGVVDADNVVTYNKDAVYNFSINVTDDGYNLANATFSFGGTDYDHIPNNNMTFWGKFNEDSIDEIVDSSTGAKPYLNGTDISWEDGPGEVGRAIVLNQGTLNDDTYLKFGDSSIGNISTVNFTVAMWLKTQVDANNNNEYILVVKDGFPNQEAFVFYLTTNFVDCSLGAKIGHGDASGYTRFEDMRFVNPCDGDWHFIGFVNSAELGSTRFFIDQWFETWDSSQDLGGDELYSGTYGNPGQLIVGWSEILQDSEMEPLNGSIADLRIYDRALTDEEITTLYETGTDRSVDVDSVYDYPLNQDSTFYEAVLSSQGVGTYPVSWNTWDFNGNTNVTDMGTFIININTTSTNTYNSGSVNDSYITFNDTVLLNLDISADEDIDTVIAQTETTGGVQNFTFGSVRANQTLLLNATNLGGGTNNATQVNITAIYFNNSGINHTTYMNVSVVSFSFNFATADHHNVSVPSEVTESGSITLATEYRDGELSSIVNGCEAEVFGSNETMIYVSDEDRQRVTVGVGGRDEGTYNYRIICEGNSSYETVITSGTFNVIGSGGVGSGGGGGGGTAGQSISINLTSTRDVFIAPGQSRLISIELSNDESERAEIVFETSGPNREWVELNSIDNLPTTTNTFSIPPNDAVSIGILVTAPEEQEDGTYPVFLTFKNRLTGTTNQITLNAIVSSELAVALEFVDEFGERMLWSIKIRQSCEGFAEAGLCFNGQNPVNIPVGWALVGASLVLPLYILPRRVKFFKKRWTLTVAVAIGVAILVLFLIPL